MTPSLEGWPTTAKEAPSSHEVRLAPLDTNPVCQSLQWFQCYLADCVAMVFMQWYLADCVPYASALTYRMLRSFLVTDLV